MTSKWTAMRWTAAVPVAVAMTLTVTGCGQPQVGTAALYGSSRITSRQLAAEVANLQAAYEANKAKLQLSYTQADMPRKVLGWMLQFATTEQAARNAHIKVSNVTQAEIQAQEQQVAASARQRGDTLSQLLVLVGLPPDLQPQLGQWLVLQNELLKKLDHGQQPTSNAAGNALLLQYSHVECLAAKSLNIKVNPQFGAFDYGQAASQTAVVAAPQTLSASGTVVKAASPSPSPAPQLSPKC